MTHQKEESGEERRQENGPQSSQPEVFSQAFRNFVTDPKDVEGLVAYALYKQSINENCERGLPVLSGSERDPGPSTINTYRNAAQTLLQAHTDKILMAEKEGLQQTAIWTKLDEISGNLLTVQTNIISYVDKRTEIKFGVIASVIGWFGSIFITVLIFASINLPNLIANLIDWVKAWAS